MCLCKPKLMRSITWTPRPPDLNTYFSFCCPKFEAEILSVKRGIFVKFWNPMQYCQNHLQYALNLIQS